MCRFVAYLGQPMSADKLLVTSRNSLLHQSMNALEAAMTVNGDGFGFGWYDKTIREEPALFRSIRPAWNDENLLHIAAMIRSKCFVGHIRAASNGSVSIANCHPFQFQKFLMMQNGGIEDFELIKKQLVHRLDEEAFLWVNGQTDTQYIFALFMTIAKECNKDRDLTLDDMARCFRLTFEQIEEMKKKVNSFTPSVYNLVITDGEQMAATRYSTRPDKQTRSLHLARASDFDMDGEGYLHFKKTEANSSVLISSEVLFDKGAVWKDVPEGCCILVDKDLQVKVIEL
jgi:glutamine amidotransferase